MMSPTEAFRNAMEHWPELTIESVKALEDVFLLDTAANTMYFSKELREAAKARQKELRGKP